MKSIIYLINFINLICLCSFINCIEVINSNQGSTQLINPGVEIQVTQQSLNLFVKKIENLAEEILEGVEIPDIQVEKDTVHLNINNGVLKQFKIDKQYTKFSFSPIDDIQFQIKISDIEVDFDYNIRETIIKISDIGTIELTDLVLQFSIEVLNDNGKINFQATSINLEKGDINVNLGDSVIKDLAADLLEKGLNSYLDSITGVISNSIVKALQTLDDVIPQIIEIDAIDCNLDLSLVQDPLIENSVLYLKLNGAFYPIGEQPLILNPSTNFQKISGNQSTKIYVHQDVINSLLNNTLKNISNVNIVLPGDMQSTCLYNSMVMVALFPQFKPYVEYQNWHAVGFDFSNFIPKFQVLDQEKKLELTLNLDLGVFLKKQFNQKYPDIILNQSQHQEQNIQEQKQQKKQNSFEKFIKEIKENMKINYKNEDFQNEIYENEDEIIEYMQNIDTELKTKINLIQDNNDITIQIFKFFIGNFEPQQIDIDEKKINLNQIQKMGAYLGSLAEGGINGLLYKNPIKLEQILNTSIEQFKIDYGNEYIVLLLDI